MQYPILKVGVVGGGTMGRGIAELIAREDIPVMVKEVNEDLMQKTEFAIEERFRGWYEKGKIDQRRLEQLIELVDVTDKAEKLSDVSLLIEAVPENMKLKEKIFREFDSILPPNIIIASNTSSLPISRLAEMTSREDKVVGMHFFNPPTRMPLVEIVRGEKTSEETLSIIEEFAKSTLRKKTIRVRDRPGFLVNCLLMPYLSEAVRGLEETYVSPKEIDKVAQKYGWPVGPFMLLDSIGIDTAYSVAKFLGESYPHRIPISKFFETMITLGRLGDKTGTGFYSASFDVEPIENILSKMCPQRNHATPEEIFEKMMLGFLNEATLAFQEKVASKEDIELGAEAGIGCPQGGPLHIIDQMGILNVITKSNLLEKKFGERFKAAGLLYKMHEADKTFFASW